MPRRKLPSPEEYGRRLAEAKRRAEKGQHERTEQFRSAFAQIMAAQDRHSALLEALQGVVDAIDSALDGVAIKGEIEGAAKALEARIAEVAESVDRATASVGRLADSVGRASAPVEMPEFPTRVLDEILGELRRLPGAMTPPMPAQPQETILAGPITVEVTSRDSNGDIDTFRVEPTRH